MDWATTRVVQTIDHHGSEPVCTTTKCSRRIRRIKISIRHGTAGKNARQAPAVDQLKVERNPGWVINAAPAQLNGLRHICPRDKNEHLPCRFDCHARVAA